MLRLFVIWAENIPQYSLIDYAGVLSVGAYCETYGGWRHQSMNESTVAYLRRRLMDARHDPDIESKLNEILEVLDDLLLNLSESDDE